MSLDILNNPLLGHPANSLFKTNESSFPVLESPSELKQLTARQIANTYYEGKAALSGDGFRIYTDDPIFGGNIEEVVIYQSMYRKAIGEIDVILFASKDGAFLLQRYMEALPNSNQLILFLEINDQYNYSTVMRAVAGAELTRNKKNSFDDILSFTRKHQVSVSPKAFQELIKNEIYRNKVSFISWFLGLKDASIGKIFTFFKQELLEGAADFFIEGIADNIAKLRISDNGWNPYPKEGQYEPVFIPNTLYKELKRFYEHEGKRNPYENLEGQKKINAQIVKSLFERIDDVKTSFNNLLANAETFFPDFIYKRIKKTLNFFFSQIGKIESFLIDPLTGMQHIIYRSHQMTNAFLCGVYNSLIDIVAGIFSIIGFIFKAVAAMDRVNDRKIEYGEMFLELTEDLMEGIMNFDYLEFFKQCLTFQIRTVFRLVKWIEEKVPQITFEKASYYYGYIIGIIVDVIVETLLTGGAAAVARLAKTVEGFILNPIEKISKAITHAGNFMTRILEFIKMTLREFKKGTKEIFSKLEKILDEVFGFGDEVADYGMTPAERRVKEKKRLKEKKIEGKNHKRLNKKIDKRYQEFIDKWEGLSLLKLSKFEIIDALKGFTKHGDEVAELIKSNKMRYEFLDDIDFEDLLRDYDYSGELTDEIILSTRAATLNRTTFYRASTSIDQFLTEVIHEGSHVIDNLLRERFLSEGKTLNEIEKIIGNIWDQEIRAYSHERDWQIKVGRNPEYNSIKDIEKHVKTEYPKK